MQKETIVGKMQNILDTGELIKTITNQAKSSACREGIRGKLRSSRGPEWLRNQRSQEPLQVGVPEGLKTGGPVESLSEESLDPPQPPIAYLILPLWQKGRYLLSAWVGPERTFILKYRHSWVGGSNIFKTERLSIFPRMSLWGTDLPRRRHQHL